MGLLWRLFAPNSPKKARRTVSKAARPARTATRAVTPKPVKQLRRAAHPVSLAELKVEARQLTHSGTATAQAVPPHCAAAHEGPGGVEGNQDEQATPARTRGGETTAAVRDGIEDALLNGNDDLEIVGESYYQENQWRLVVRAGLTSGYAITSTPC